MGASTASAGSRGRRARPRRAGRTRLLVRMAQAVGASVPLALAVDRSSGRAVWFGYVMVVAAVAALGAVVRRLLRGFDLQAAFELGVSFVVCAIVALATLTLTR